MLDWRWGGVLGVLGDLMENLCILGKYVRLLPICESALEQDRWKAHL